MVTSPANRQYLIVEDQPDTCRWLVETVREAFGVEPATADSVAAARAWLAAERDRDRPMLVLVDLGLPDAPGTELIAEIATTDPAATLVVTTVYEDDDSLVRALGAGAHGYLLKDFDVAGLRRQLLGIDQGEVAISPAIARRLLARFRTTAVPLAAITPRETEVLRAIGRGLTIAETGILLAISDQTAATHVKAIYRKLDIASRAEAALEARRRGLV